MLKFLTVSHNLLPESYLSLEFSTELTEGLSHKVPSDKTDALVVLRNCPDRDSINLDSINA